MNRENKMYTVYNIETTMSKNSYKTAAAAKAAVTRLNKGKGANVYDWASLEDYNTKVVHMVERRNAMTGEMFMERSNVPFYASASSETYWCS